MDSNRNLINENQQQRNISAVSAIFDGIIVEMIYHPTQRQSGFAVFQGDTWSFQSEFSLSPLERLIPYSPDNNLIKNEVVLLPSEPEEYGSEAELISEIQTFIHRYVDISPLFEKIASYYVLFSWVYDGFNELPYLRLRGDPGSGKTRFLLTVGALCYKPIFASGASTISPIFRILDSIRGTLIIDEGDFRSSDERAEIVKILNNGNARGFPVLRSEVSPNREFNPRAYSVFGPKLVATRGYFEDQALESRFITEEMGQQGQLRTDVPINLSPNYKIEALHIRNKLLLFRFRNFHKREPTDNLVDRSIEPRLNQIFVPLLSIIDDAEAREDLHELARQYHQEMLTERSMNMEAQLLEIIRDMLASSIDSKLAIKDIASWFADRYGEDYERKITPKWIGMVIRKRLKLKTQKSNGVFVIPIAEMPALHRLYEKYDINKNNELENAKADIQDYPADDGGDGRK